MTQKIQSIQRCVKRARQERSAAGSGFRVDWTRQDAALLNITRACEQAIDLANHVVRERGLGIPATSAESFLLLERDHVIEATLRRSLAAMVGFRNTAVHQYMELDLDIVDWVITEGLDDVLTFTRLIAERGAAGWTPKEGS
ncbi:MAG: DUF86 domain-containing protein [bacterium]|nr:DUF86 domain-containing protein [bacterium]